MLQHYLRRRTNVKKLYKLMKKKWNGHSIKIFLIALIAFSLQSFISIDTQKVTLKMDNVSIEQILWKIKEQTKIEFVYSNEEIAPYKKMSINVKGKPLRDVLDDLLKHTGLRYEVSNDVVVITKKSTPAKSAAQTKNITVTGSVTDINKEPLPGVSVFIKGTDQGVYSDVDGKFSIEMQNDPQTQLTFSYMGMKEKDVTVGTKSRLDVIMEDEANLLEEVMVVAYGTVKKEAYTGSAQVVKGDQIMKEAAPLSAEKALQGYVAGVRITQTDGQPGAKATVQIRGIGSINGNIEPLYVIDGVPMVSGDASQVMSSNVMTALNPNDIESMTVLKDAAATSLYGSRAANGVIIITTKQGKAGKTVFNVDYEHGFTSTAMPHELFGLYLNGREYTEYSLEGLKNRYLYDRKALPGQTNYDSGNTALQEEALNYAYKNLNSKAKIIHPDDKLDGKFNYATADMSKYLSHARNTDWAEELFKGGHEDKVNISARGGNEKLRFFSSLGYFNQVGLVPSSNFERFTGKLNVENKATDYLKFSLNQSISYTDQSGTSSGGYYSNPIWGVKNLNPTAPVYFDDGEYYRYPGFSTKIPNYVKNVKEQVKKSNNLRSITNLTITVDFTKWLSFRTVNGLDYMNLLESAINGIDSHDGRNEKGTLDEYFSKLMDLTTSNTLTFNKGFGKHKVNALLGYEAKKYYRKVVLAEGSGFISDNFMDLSNAAKATGVAGEYSDDRLVSYFVKGDYNYDDKYYFSASYRRDGSSRLAENVRWGNFYALSAAWDMTRESFIKDINWINNLRLKTSYGTTGNLPGDYYESQALFSLSSKYNDKPVFFLYKLGNPMLTWEHSYTWNIGIDFSILNSRLSGTLEYYNKITDNLLNKASVSDNTGFSTILVNEGKLANNGVELTLSSRNITKKNFTWSTDFNISWMRAIVKELPDDVFSSPRIFRQNEHLYSFYAREWAGVNPQTGEPLWYVNKYDTDGKTPIKDGSVTSNVSEANQVVLDKAYPNFYGGLTNRFSFYGFDLSFLLTFTLGGHMYHTLDRQTADGLYIGRYNPTYKATKDYWRQPGDNASQPMVIHNNPYQPNTISSRHILSTDHLRLKNLTLAYNLPKSFVKKLSIQNAKIYFNGTDLLTFYKYKDINPEVSYTGNTNAGSRYPAIKSFRLGINIQF